MTKEQLLAVLDKNINQEQLLKDVLALTVQPFLMDVKAKIEKGEIDPIPGTDLDKELMLKAVDALLVYSAV